MSLSNLDDQNRAQALERTLQTGGALVADELVTELAHKEGDEAVMRIAQHLSAPVIATMVADSDMVKPSVLHAAITPEQFRKVVRRVGAKWGAASHEDCDNSTLLQFQQELLQFFCAFFLANEDEARKSALLQALADEPHGIDSLAFSMIHEKDFAHEPIEKMGTNDRGDFREIIALIRTYPTLWQRFTAIVANAFVDEEHYREFVHDCAAEIYMTAINDGAVKREEAEEADSLFTPLT